MNGELDTRKEDIEQNGTEWKEGCDRVPQNSAENHKGHTTFNKVKMTLEW